MWTMLHLRHRWPMVAQEGRRSLFWRAGNLELQAMRQSRMRTHLARPNTFGRGHRNYVPGLPHARGIFRTRGAAWIERDSRAYTQRLPCSSIRRRTQALDVRAARDPDLPDTLAARGSGLSAALSRGSPGGTTPRRRMRRWLDARAGDESRLVCRGCGWTSTQTLSPKREAEASKCTSARLKTLICRTRRSI